MEVIYNEDQADREKEDFWPRIEYYSQRDGDRRIETNKLLESGKLKSGKDYYQAAMIFHHGANLADLRKAKFLIKKSLTKDFEPAKWLFAAITDRTLVSQNKPQKFGTQYSIDQVTGKWKLSEYDPKTTDQERSEYNVPSLKNQLKRQLRKK